MLEFIENYTSDYLAGARLLFTLLIVLYLPSKNNQASQLDANH